MKTIESIYCYKLRRLKNNQAQEHLRLVHSVCNRIKNTCSENYDDLFQVGCIGLARACKEFDKNLENAFSSFAVPWIQGEIQHYLRDKRSAVRLPRKEVEAIAKVKKIAARFRALGREVSEVKIAQRHGISELEWHQINLSHRNELTVSLEELASEIPDNYENLGVDTEKFDLYLSSLKHQERALILDKFYLNKSNKEICKKYKISNDSQLELKLKSILKKLKLIIENGCN